MKQKEDGRDEFVDVIFDTAFNLVRHSGKIVFLGLTSYCVSQIGFWATVYKMPEIIVFTLSSILFSVRSGERKNGEPGVNSPPIQNPQSAIHNFLFQEAEASSAGSSDTAGADSPSYAGNWRAATNSSTDRTSTAIRTSRALSPAWRCDTV